MNNEELMAAQLQVAKDSGHLCAETGIKNTASCGVSAEMPRYRSHKEVWALKIKEIKQAPADQERCNAGGDWYLVPEDDRYAPIMVGHNSYYSKFEPHVGGYYVVYKDGYKSYSPAAPFEEGYTRL